VAQAGRPGAGHNHHRDREQVARAPRSWLSTTKPVSAATAAWWSLRSLRAVRWLVEHGFDPWPEVAALRSRL
jgi:hypothetical protein